MGTSALKAEIRNALLEGDFEKIVQHAMEDKKVLSMLISFTYDKESIVCWRAIEAMGKAAGAVARKDPSTVRNIVQRLLWSMGEESGGIGWSAPEMLGEIVVNTPDTCRDIPLILLSFKGEESFLPGVLWSIARIAGAGIRIGEGVEEFVMESLSHRSPLVRGLALSSALTFNITSEKVRSLICDGEGFRVYEDRELVERTVGNSAREVLDKMGRT
ncbi:MAG TPA: hypothetical protein VEI28_04295 [Thermodesulfovibrionales bacterium]|nr:hypothetical protein [Thermodesulfovibrionales bacterium]